MSSRSLLIALAVLALAHTAEVRRPGSMSFWRLFRLLPHGHRSSAWGHCSSVPARGHASRVRIVCTCSRCCSTRVGEQQRLNRCQLVSCQLVSRPCESAWCACRLVSHPRPQALGA